jgi:hypothetical protein
MEAGGSAGRSTGHCPFPVQVGELKAATLTTIGRAPGHPGGGDDPWVRPGVNQRGKGLATEAPLSTKNSSLVMNTSNIC